MARPNAGPTGAGLIPPTAGGPQDPPADPEVDVQPPAPDPEDRSDDDVDLTGLPPVDDAEDPDGEDPEDDDPEVDIEEIERRVEERLQRRFDKAITKITRRLESQYRQPDPDPDEEEEEPPAPRQRQRPAPRRSGDSIALRTLARDRLADEMATSGRSAQIAAKKALDAIVPHLREEDADEVIDDVVAALAGSAGDLIKIGSDRKVRQLQGLGLIPQTTTQQNGGGVTGRKRPDPATAMRKGAQIAASRHPRRSG